MYEDFKADIKLEGRDIDFNMSEEEIESGIEEPLDPALEDIARLGIKHHRTEPNCPQEIQCKKSLDSEPCMIKF